MQHRFVTTGIDIASSHLSRQIASTPARSGALVEQEASQSRRDSVRGSI